jgi:LacI family transcriptional regulator
MSKPTTLRGLARRLDLSVATVSHALHGSTQVSAATRKRVRLAAARVGYQLNPLLGAALSAVRRGRQKQYRGALALVDSDDDNRSQYIVFHREVIAGAAARAQELGFQTELFWLGEKEPALPARRLADVLHARGMGGAVLLPFNTAQDLSDFDLSRISAVQMDHCLVKPRLHTILPDHYVSMFHALERLTRLGYRRIGLCLAQQKDARIKNKWSAAFRGFFHGHAHVSGLPVLIEPQVTRERFLPWFQRYQPEVILGHEQAIVHWLRDIGVRVPASAGFFNLNLTERTGPCAGLDLGPRRLGAAAIDTVVAMMHRQERGVPAQPQSITLEAVWNDGPTLRRPSSPPHARGRQGGAFVGSPASPP